MIKLTREQAQAFSEFIKGATSLQLTLENVIKYHGLWSNHYEPLNDLPFDDLITLIVTKEYEVERTIEEIIDDHLGEALRKYHDNAERAISELKQELKQEGLI